MYTDYVRPAHADDAEPMGALQAANMIATLERLLGRNLSEATRTMIDDAAFADQWKATILTHSDVSGIYVAKYGQGSGYNHKHTNGKGNIRTNTKPNVVNTGGNSNEKIAGFAAGTLVEPYSSRTFLLSSFEMNVNIGNNSEHGARLLAALADTARTIEASTLCTWLFAGDDVATSFFASAGFAPAGPQQILTIDGHQITQHLWWADL